MAAPWCLSATVDKSEQLLEESAEDPGLLTSSCQGIQLSQMSGLDYCEHAVWGLTFSCCRNAPKTSSDMPSQGARALMYDQSSRTERRKGT